MKQEIATHQPQQSNDTSAILAVIERVALDKDADINKLERMIALQERILTRDAEQAFSSAFARMQAEIPTIIENGKIKVNNEVRSKYATFEDIVEAVRPILTQYGFGINFRIKQEENRIAVTATLRHELGHSESTDFVASADTSGSKNSVQAIGSTISYGKRYAMCALLNIATRGEDDDAQSLNFVDTESAAKIDNLLKESKVDREAFLKWMGVKDVREIKSRDFNKAIAGINKKAKATKVTHAA